MDAAPSAETLGESPTGGAVLPSLAFLSGGGKLGAMVRAFHWSETPLGPPQQWPQSLRMAVSTCLSCSFPIVIWWGRDLILLYNDAYISILAGKHPRALGQRGEECWREVWSLVGPMLHRVLDHAEPFTADDLQLMVWRHGYFEECFFCFSYSPIYEENGDVSGVFCPVIETTDKIVEARRHETLRELSALRRTKSIKEACQQVIGVLARNGRDVPFAYLYMLSEDGASASLMCATDASPGVSARPLAQIVEWPLAQALTTPHVLETLDGIRLPTGSWSEPAREVYLAPVLLPGSQTPGAILVAGVSPHKRLDQSYRSFFELLASQVGSTIADTLAYETERKRAEALAAIDHAKTLFFSNISQEFRTPLTLMLGPLEDALNSPALSGTERDRLDIVRRNALRLLKLVNSLLEFSRLEAGRAQASYEPTHLAALTIDLASNFRSACEKANLTLSVDCSAFSEVVYVDRNMWEKIVLNLLSNAFKFTLQGGITIRLRNVEDHAELSVKDTGVGVPDYEIPRLFERFHRIEGQVGRTCEGSGIGLALVQELVKLHGGTIAAASEVGRGTTFTIRLPLGSTHLPQDRIGGERKLASTSITADTYVQEALRWLPDSVSQLQPTDSEASEHLSFSQGARVLVADDNADMRSYMRSLLGQHLEVETVPDGQAALDSILKRRPNLVLADVMMPRMDGFALLNAIRGNETLCDIPVIMLSARAGQESKIEALAAGADDYLVKPFSGPELMTRVSAYLGLLRIRRETALRESEARLRSAIEVGRLGLWDWNLRSGEIHWSAEQFRMEGYTVGEVTPSYEAWAARIHPDDRPAAEAAVRRAMERHEEYENEFRVLHPDGTIRWLHGRGRFFYDAEDQPVRMVGAMTDTTDRREWEERQRILVAELQHRTRNLLAVVRSITDQLLSRSTSVPGFRDAFRARLDALARVNGLLSRLNEGDRLTFNELLETELAAHGLFGQNGYTGRIKLSGPEDVRLRSSTVQTLALGLHELATNALKHGALSGPEGVLSILWYIDSSIDSEPQLRVDWRESGVSIDLGSEHLRHYKGYGRELIEQALPYQLNAKTTYDITREGVHWTIVLPIPVKSRPEVENIRHNSC